MTTRIQREIKSAEAAFGAACSDLADILHAAGHERPYDVAREYLEQLRHDGWKYRPREPEPARRAPGEVEPASPPLIAAWRQRVHADVERAQRKFEAREAGRSA